jgi:hypothetical protein
MATAAFASPVPYRRLSLAEIDAVVSARLGPTRTQGNEQPACFNRQVAMYLAKHVGGWSTTLIGRFYNGRDHSTVCHGIQRIEALRESDPNVDALLTELKQQLHRGGEQRMETEALAGPDICTINRRSNIDDLADAIAARVWAHIEARMQRSNAE